MIRWWKTNRELRSDAAILQYHLDERDREISRLKERVIPVRKDCGLRKPADEIFAQDIITIAVDKCNVILRELDLKIDKVAPIKIPKLPYAYYNGKLYTNDTIDRVYSKRGEVLNGIINSLKDVK